MLERTQIKGMSNASIKPGFSLFELIIGLLISTILTTICFTIYQQIARSTQFVHRTITNDTKAMILRSRLQQDLLGVTPLWFTPAKYEALAKKAGGPENRDDKTEQKESKVDENGDNFFYAKNHQDGTDKGGTLDLFSFVTTSGMQMYGSESKMCVRVVYSLKKNPSSEQNFSLFRKEIEAGEFSIKAASSSEYFYEIASLVKSCSVEYGFIDKPQAKTKKEEKPEPQNQAPEKITWLNSWEAKQDKSEKAEKKPLIPKFIKMKLVFFQPNIAHEQEYEFLLTTPIDGTITYQSFTKKSHQPGEQGNQSGDQDAA